MNKISISLKKHFNTSKAIEISLKLIIKESVRSKENRSVKS